MNANDWGLLTIVSPVVLTLLAAFAYLPSIRSARVVRGILLLGALGASIYGDVSTLRLVSPSLDWMIIPGQTSSIQLSAHIDPSVGLLSIAVAALTVAMFVSLPDHVARSEVTLLLLASAATYVVIAGGHLLFRLAASEMLMLTVLLLVVGQTKKITQLVSAQRIAGGALLLAALTWNGQAGQALLIVVAALSLGGGFPFHRSLLVLESCGRAQRAHLSGLLLLAAGGLVLRLVDNPEALGWWSSRVGWLVIPAALMGLLSLASTDLRRAQLWSWSSQLGFAVAMTLYASALHTTQLAAAVWICLALVRPAASLAADTVVVALGDEPQASRWGGLASALPVACWMSVVAGFSIAGVPPLGMWAPNAGLLAGLAPTTPEFILIAAMPLLLLLPSLRLACWPFFGPPRHSVLAPQEQTDMPAVVVAVIILCCAAGALLPVALMINQPLPSMHALAAPALVALVAGLIVLLTGRHRSAAGLEDSPTRLRQYLGDGLPPPWGGRWLTGILRQLYWMMELVSLLPGAAAQGVRVIAWGVTWLESRPLWWVVLTVVGFAITTIGGCS